jgi:hypothetical protein
MVTIESQNPSGSHLEPTQTGRRHFRNPARIDAKRGDRCFTPTSQEYVQIVTNFRMALLPK